MKGHSPDNPTQKGIQGSVITAFYLWCSPESARLTMTILSTCRESACLLRIFLFRTACVWQGPFVPLLYVSYSKVKCNHRPQWKGLGVSKGLEEVKNVVTRLLNPDSEIWVRQRVCLNEVFSSKQMTFFLWGRPPTIPDTEAAKKFLVCLNDPWKNQERRYPPETQHFRNSSSDEGVYLGIQLLWELAWSCLLHSREGMLCWGLSKSLIPNSRSKSKNCSLEIIECVPVTKLQD